MSPSSPGALQIEVAPDPRGLVRDGGAIEAQNVRHEDGVGQPVMRIVDRADRVASANGWRPAPFWKATAPMLAATAIWARADEVLAVGDRRRQVLLDEAHALERDAFGHRMVGRGTVGLEIVGERVPCRSRR